MCRMVAYVGGAISPAHVVFGGTHSLYEQSWAPRELLSGSVNADGYGVVWYAGGRAARIAETRPIWHDSDLRSTLGAVESPCIVAALRNGTPDIPMDRSGSPPLLLGAFSFVLNGFVPDFCDRHMRTLRHHLPDELYAQLRGSSDSETLFLIAVAAISDGASMSEALARTVQIVRESVGTSEAQLNMLMSDGHSLAAVRASTVLLTNSLYVAKRPPFAPDGVVLASEAPEEGAAWAPVDGHSWLEVTEDGDLRGDVLD